MAEIEKTQNYGLSIFSDEQTSLDFLEFRQMLAGANETEDTFSNMQKIDAVLKQCATAIDDNLISAKNYTEEQIAAFKLLNDELIKAAGDGSMIIGGENGKPMEFRDGTQISYLKDGVFTVNGVEVEYIRIVDYMLRYNSSNGHLQISYKPKPTNVVPDESTEADTGTDVDEGTSSGDEANTSGGQTAETKTNGTGGAE